MPPLTLPAGFKLIQEEGAPPIVKPPAGFTLLDNQAALEKGAHPNGPGTPGTGEFKLRPGLWDQAYNNFGLAKDQMEKDMWEGLQHQADEDPTSLGGMVRKSAELLGNPEFFKNRIQANEIDIRSEAAKIYQTKNDNEINFSDALTDPYHFFGTQLPKTLGGMAGLMAEPMIIGAGASLAAGAMGAGPIGISLAAGLTALLASRPLESVTEAQQSFQDVHTVLTEANNRRPAGQKLSPAQIDAKAKDAFNYTYNKNLQLGAWDAAEVMLAVVPLGAYIKPFAKNRNIVQRSVERLAKAGMNHPAMEFLVKEGIVSQKEGLEEILQEKFQREAVNKQVDDQDKRKASWADLFQDPDAISQYKGGVLGGLFMGGGLQLVKKASDIIKGASEDVRTFSQAQIQDEQDKLKTNLTAKAVWNGTELELKNSIEKLAASGALADPVIKGEDAQKASVKTGQDIINQITEGYADAVAIKKANPKIVDGSNFALALQNHRAILDLKEQDKVAKAAAVIEEKTEGDTAAKKPKLSKIEKQINKIAEENERIFAGDDVYNERSKPKTNPAKPAVPGTQSGEAGIPAQEPGADNKPGGNEGAAMFEGVQAGGIPAEGKTEPVQSAAGAVPKSTTEPAAKGKESKADDSVAGKDDAGKELFTGVKGPEIIPEKPLTTKERIEKKKSLLPDRLKRAEDKIKKQEEIVQKAPKIDISDAFKDIDDELMDDNTDLGLKAKAANDPKGIHDDIKSADVSATEKQIRAQENLLKVGAIEGIDDSTMGAASETIQQGLRRLWWLETNTKKPDEAVAYNNARKAIQALMYAVDDKKKLQTADEVLSITSMPADADLETIRQKYEELDRIAESAQDTIDKEENRTKPREWVIEDAQEMIQHVKDAKTYLRETFTPKEEKRVETPEGSTQGKVEQTPATEASKPAEQDNAGNLKNPKKVAFKSLSTSEIAAQEDVRKLMDASRKVGVEILNRKREGKATKALEKTQGAIKDRVAKLVGANGYHPGDVLQFGGYGKFLYIQKKDGEYILQDLLTYNFARRKSLEGMSLVSKTADTSLTQVEPLQEQKLPKEKITEFGLRDDALSMTEEQKKDYFDVVKHPGEVISARVRHYKELFEKQARIDSVPKGSLEAVRDKFREKIKTYKTKQEAIAAANKKAGMVIQKMDFLGISDASVVNLAFKIIDELLTGAIAIQEALQRMFKAVNGSKLLTDEQKQDAQRKLIDYLNKIEQSAHVMANPEATEQERGQAMDTITDAYDQRLAEDFPDEFGAGLTQLQDKHEAFTKRVQDIYTRTKTGKPVSFIDEKGQPLTERKVRNRLWTFAKTVKSETNLLEQYSKLPIIGPHLIGNGKKEESYTEAHIRSLHNILKSTIKHYYVHALNLGNSYDLYLSNNLKNNDSLSKEISDRMRAHFQKNNVAEDYEKILRPFILQANQFRAQIRREYSAGKKFTEMKPVVDKYFDWLAQAMQAVTGLNKKYWIDYQLDNKRFGKKTYDSAQELAFRTPGTINRISSFLLPDQERRSFQQLENALFVKDPRQDKSQVDILSSAITRSKIELIDRFKSVIKKLKSTDELVSHLSVDLSLMNTDEMQNSQRAKNNPWVKLFEKTAPVMMRMDGLKNRKNQKAIDSGNASTSDIRHFQILAFLNTSLKLLGTDRYFQHFEQQSDNNSREFIEAKKYSLEEARSEYEKIKDKLDPEYPRWIKTKLVPEIEKYVRQRRLTLQQINPEKAEEGINSRDIVMEFAEQFALNFAINKYYMDQFFYPPADIYGNANYPKGYMADQVKRKIAASGTQLNFDVMREAYEAKMERKLGEDEKYLVLNHAVINDPTVLIKLSKEVDFGGKEQDVTDGFIFMLDTTGQAVEAASGAQLAFNQQIKSQYSKVNKDMSRTYLKGNTVVLNKEMADKFSEKDKDGNETNVLAQLYDYMQIHKLDMITFKSAAKKSPPALQNKINWVYDKEGNLRIKGNLPVPNIERLDIRYYFVQQDLRQSDKVTVRKDVRQKWYHFMKFSNAEAVQKKINDAMVKYQKQLYKEIVGKSESEQRQWFLKNIPDVKGNKRIRALLSDNTFSLDNPKIRRILNFVFSNVIEDKVLGIKVPGGYTVSIPNLGVNLKSIRVENGMIVPPEAMLPAGYKSYGLKSRAEKINDFINANPGLKNMDDQISKIRGDYAFVTRVPSTELHSTSLVEIKDWLPKSMGNVIMTDQATSKIAGEDYDGDARYVWVQYRDRKTKKVIKGDGSFKSLMNEAFDMEVENYLNADNFERIINPIDTSKVRDIIKEYKTTNNKLNAHVPESLSKAILSNQEAEKVIGILARANAVYNFLKKSGASLKTSITIPNIVRQPDGNVSYGERVLKGLNHLPKQDRAINVIAANNLNHATDNLKEQSLEYLGLTEGTAMAYSFLEYFGADEYTVVKFMHNPVIQDYIAAVRESKSPNSPLERNEIYRSLAEHYMPGSTEASEDRSNPNAFDPFLKFESKNVKLSPKQWIGIDLTPYEKIRVLKFFQYVNTTASDFSRLSKLIKGIEDGVKSYSELMVIDSLMNRIFNATGKLKDKDTRLNLGSFKGIEFVKPIEINVITTRDFYKDQLVTTDVSRQIIDELYEMIMTVEDKRIKKAFTPEQADAIVNGIGNYAINEALQITETNDVLSAVAKDWYNGLPETSDLRKLLTLDPKTNRLSLAKELRTARLDDEEIDVYRQAFEEAFKDNSDAMMNLLKYHIRLYGYGDETKSYGGFSEFFSTAMDKVIGDKMAEVKKVWKEYDPQRAMFAAAEIFRNNPELIPEIETAGTLDTHLEAMTESGNPMGQYSPDIIKTMVHGRMMVLDLEVRKNAMGNAVVYQYDATKGRAVFELDPTAKLTYNIYRQDQNSSSFPKMKNSKTESGNVKVFSDPWKELNKYSEGEALVAMRNSKKPDAHFGNPFSDKQNTTTKVYDIGTTVAERVQAFRDWLSDENPYPEIEPKRREWLRKEIASGKWKGKTILYYKELGEHSHANALDELINQKKTGPSGLKYQSASNEQPAKSDPVLRERIRKRLSTAFPGVLGFSDARKFQAFLDRNYPGEHFDGSKIGAAIGNAVFIDPEKAVQSTAIHEHAHIYWDSLPADDRTKRALERMFGNEEAAIQAIGEAGVEVIKSETSSRFIELLKQFWLKVKQLFGAATKEQLARIFAARVLDNKKPVISRVAFLKYQGAVKTTPQQDRIIRIMQDLKDKIVGPDGKLRTPIVPLKGVTRLIDEDPAYAYDAKGEDYTKEQIRGIKLHSIAQQTVEGKSLADIDAEGAPGISATQEYQDIWKATPIPADVVKKVHDYVRAFVDAEHAKGNIVLAETHLASAGFRLHGILDLMIVTPAGEIMIRDWKFSPDSKTGGSYDLKKKKINALQQALYALMLQYGDTAYGYKGRQEGHDYANFAEISDLGVIPGKITIDGQKNVTDIEFEDVVPFKYQDYLLEAHRLIAENIQTYIDEDTEKLKGVTDYMNIEQYAIYRGKPLADWVARRKELVKKKAEQGLLEDEQKEVMSLGKKIRRFEAEHAQYTADFIEFKELLKNTDWSSLTEEQLVAHIDRLRRMQITIYNMAVKEVIGPNLQRIYLEKQSMLTGVKKSVEDLKKRDVLFLKPSDMRSSNPDQQYAMKKMLTATQTAQQVLNDAEKEETPLAQKVIAENSKKLSLAQKAKDFSSIPFVAGNSDERYFANEYDDKGNFKDPEDLTNDLTSAEREHVRVVLKWTKRFENIRAESFDDNTAAAGNYMSALPVNRNFWEEYVAQNGGFLKAFALWLGDDKELNNIKLSYSDPKTGQKKLLRYGEIVLELNSHFINSNFLTKAKLNLLLLGYHRRAENALVKKHHEGLDGRIDFSEEAELTEKDVTYTYIVKDGKLQKEINENSGKHVINEQSHLVGQYQFKRSKNMPITRDTHRAFMQYVKEMSYLEQVNPIMPEILALQAQTQQRKGVRFLNEFLDKWVRTDILGQKEVGFLGRDADTIIRFLTNWTYFTAMTFNLGLGVFNLTTGVYNTIVTRGYKRQAIGVKRMAQWKKAEAILDHYRVISIRRDPNPRISAGSMFTWLSDVTIRASEQVVQGTAFLGAISEETWNNFDDKGNIIDPKKELATEEVVRLRLEISDVQGAYAEYNKRNYRANAYLAAAMQFKTWFPDFLNSRIADADKNLFGEKKKGILRSLSWMASAQHLQNMITMKPEFWKSDDIDARNMRANLRGMCILGSVFVLWAAAHGDDEDKNLANQIWKGLSQMGMIYDMNSMVRMATVPSTETLQRTVDAISAIAKLKTFQRESQYGDKGDLVFPSKVGRLLPYGNLSKPVLTNWDYND